MMERNFGCNHDVHDLAGEETKLVAEFIEVMQQRKKQRVRIQQ